MTNHGNNISLSECAVTNAALPWIHASNDELELYSLNRLHPAFLPSIEEHLLVCPECGLKLEEFDEYHNLLKQALLR